MQDHQATDQETIKFMTKCSVAFVVVTFVVGYTCAIVF